MPKYKIKTKDGKERVVDVETFEEIDEDKIILPKKLEKELCKILFDEVYFIEDKGIIFRVFVNDVFGYNNYELAFEIDSFKDKKFQKTLEKYGIDVYELGMSDDILWHVTTEDVLYDKASKVYNARSKEFFDKHLKKYANGLSCSEFFDKYWEQQNA